MYQHTRQERQEAQKKVPEALNAFLESDALQRLYAGIVLKHTLTWEQGGAITNLVNLTLLGLEQESALETNLHQVLPELSNSTARELVADLNDRVFKEARRRVAENIVTPEPEWDEEEFGPKPSEDEPPLPTDAELEALEKQQEEEGWKPPEEESAPDEPVTPAETEAGTPVPTLPAGATNEPKSQTSSSIVATKLALPSAQSIRNVQISQAPANEAASNIPLKTLPEIKTPASAENTPPEAPAPVRDAKEVGETAISRTQTTSTTSTPERTNITPPSPPSRYSDGNDPYRETPE